ncbi:Trp biosynthesis-associated membrane protein [Nocardiopsis potens]|uniref:Trp biosynthesis-associated membrane protein n=1 Tax=Nocardiopsis potens TaxID=1246458 RepID=UPI0003452B21|nr:Trp biosynthesis-associated membrane protein [Nocardiopsis potens]
MTGAARAPRREYAVTVLAAAAGAAGLIAATGQTWAEGTVAMPGPVADVPVRLTGTGLAPAAAALGWAGLAALAAVAATAGRARIAVGALMALFGGSALAVLWTATRPGRLAAAVAEQAAAAGDAAAPHPLWTWPAVAAAGAALLAAAGAATALRGPSWPGMSSRYDRHSAPERGPRSGPADPADLWKSLDGGDDPTLDPAPGAAGPAAGRGPTDPETAEHDRARVTGAQAAQKEP